MDQELCELAGNCTNEFKQSWGQYSPYFAVPSEIDSSVPKDCHLTFAQVLSRHGSRAPTAHKAVAYQGLIGRIQQSVTEYAGGYEFIRDYVYDLGADDLTLYGENEMVASGESFYKRYKDLAETEDPFVRASGSDRVIVSAQNFTRGLYAAQGKTGEDQVSKILVVPEVDGYNNTLDAGTCTAFEEGPSAETGQLMQDAWVSRWLPAVRDRLNKKLPGADLALNETMLLMDLCPFNTAATPDATPSPFCGLFSKDEWRSYDYYESLDKWYGHGPGNALGPSQGVGFVNELIARLTNKPVDDATTTNSTLDSSDETFPLHKALYADFSHDNLMTSVYGAMGLYDGADDLPVRYKVPPTRRKGYSASWTVSFGSRMYVEKMRCDGGRDKADTGQGEQEELVRVLVNERVIPLQGCDADYRGRCKLAAFVESLDFARSGGKWQECFA
jgi:hypothetical protein